MMVHICIVQGSPSSGLISIDFDEPEALEEFLTLNSGLRNTLTTSAARGANLWFKMQGDYPKLTRLKRVRSIWAEAKHWRFHRDPWDSQEGNALHIKRENPLKH